MFVNIVNTKIKACNALKLFVDAVDTGMAFTQHCIQSVDPQLKMYK